MVANIIVIMHYPPDKASELGPIAVKILPTLPKYIKRVGDSPYIMATETDYMNVTVYDVEDAKVAEAVKELVKFYHQYCAVPGFKWVMYNALPLKEALPIIGLKYPTPK